MSLFRRRGTDRAEPRYYVRDAAQADLPAVLRMKAASWREAYGHVRDEEFFQRAESTLDRQVEHWRGTLERGIPVWMAEDESGRCVGMACAVPARSEHVRDRADLPATELSAIYVLQSAQGSGVAEILLDRALGDAPAFLRVLADNPRARAFYRRHGFHDDGPPRDMDGPWAGLQEQLMVRRGGPGPDRTP